MVCSEDVFWPRLGVLGVPLITVPDTYHKNKINCQVENQNYVYIRTNGLVVV
jgi:hypothetical protein